MTQQTRLNALRDGKDEGLESVGIGELVSACLSHSPRNRLLLPTIQRSLVWRNEQIINYWDTLLRGWFPGLMLIHKAGSGDELSYTARGIPVMTEAGDLELFDGQQRMAAILLGFGEGPLARTHRLWVEFNGSASPADQRGYTLRVTTIGQPFGYERTEPNNKLPLDVRRKRWDRWFRFDRAQSDTNQLGLMRDRLHELLGVDGVSSVPKDTNGSGDEYQTTAALMRELAFDLSLEGPLGADDDASSFKILPLAPIARQASAQLFASRQLIPGRDYPGRLSEAVERRYQAQAEKTVATFQAIVSSSEGPASRFWRALEQAVDLEVAVKKISGEVLNPENYQEFFKRVGQGGTALSEDELSYSLIKSTFPKTRQAIEAIVKDENVGHLGSPTQIALAGLRLARINKLSHKEAWQRVSKPNARWTQKLVATADAPVDPKYDLEPDVRKAVADNFRAMIEPSRGKEPSPLHHLVTGVRKLLTEHEAGNKTGFPKILLGRLPNGFLDLAILLTGHERFSSLEDNELKRAILLWAITFGEPEPLTSRLAEKIGDAHRSAKLDEQWFASIIRTLEKEGKCYLLPTEDELVRAENWSEGKLSDHEGGRLHSWEDRFAGANSPDRQVSKSLNEMNFWSAKGKNALLWLQRDYLDRTFGHFDPTSDRDDDLPIDLDHIVSRDAFDFRWDKAGFPKAMNGETLDDQQQQHLRNYRSGLGNSLGNLRWLCASENRRRGSGRGSQLDGGDLKTIDPVEEAKFNTLLGRLGENAKGMDGWTNADLMDWQDLVLTRTVRLVRHLINDSAMNRLISQDNIGERLA